MNETNRPPGVTPTVAIIGRPNVGKSALFNRLIGRRQAIVHDQPGVTRDRIVGTVELEGRAVELIDTGGLVPGRDPLGLGEQVFLAIEESDLLLLVVDGKDGLVAADERVWESVRRTGKPTILVVNKGDTRLAQRQFGEFYALGIADQLLVSAEHGRGVAAEADDGDAEPIAVVGRPNVGKSSLVNRLLGESRVLVSPVAGTTRDPIDTLFEWGGHRFRLIDTAGIRRRSQVSGTAEDLAVMFARRQMERARLVVLVLDAAQGVTTGDLTIAGTAWELGRAVVVAVNKWDLLGAEARSDLEQDWPRLAELLARPARLNLSALTGRHIDRLIESDRNEFDRVHFEVSSIEHFYQIENLGHILAVVRQDQHVGGRKVDYSRSG